MKRNYFCLLAVFLLSAPAALYGAGVGADTDGSRATFASSAFQLNTSSAQACDESAPQDLSLIENSSMLDELETSYTYCPSACLCIECQEDGGILGPCVVQPAPPGCDSAAAGGPEELQQLSTAILFLQAVGAESLEMDLGTN